MARFFNPSFPIHEIFGAGHVTWLPLVSYFSTVSLCLAVAILLLNRRELSHATE